jgi:hypothetical protein
MEMLVKVCATTCIFVSFPITNTYFLIAKRSLLLEYPSYIYPIIPQSVLTYVGINK